MPRKWAQDDIPKPGQTLPAGVFRFRIGPWKADKTGENAKTPGALMYRSTFNVLEPKEYKGAPYFDQYVIGNEDDLDGDDPDTWKASIGAQRMNEIMTKIKVKNSDPDKCCKLSEGKEILALLSVQTEQRDGPFKGRKRNRVEAFYAIGERKVGVDDDAGDEHEPDEPEPDEDEPVTPRRAGKAATVEEPEEPEEPEGDGEAEPETPPKTGKGGKKPDQVKCSICKQLVAREDFPEHVEGHEE